MMNEDGGKGSSSTVFCINTNRVRAADVLEFLNQAVEHLGCSDSDTKLVQVWFARGKD